MNRFFVHTSDLHFSNNDIKRAEVVAVCNHLVSHIQNVGHRIDAIVIAGDLVDEYDGRIRVDSPCWRDVVRFIRQAASVAPVLIVRGTPSHDRTTPALLRDISTDFPVFVAMEPCRVFLDRGRWVGCSDNWGACFSSPLFSCLPSPDRVAGSSIAESGVNTRESVTDLLRKWGQEMPVSFHGSHVIVGHGTLDGADMGGIVASDDQEFALESFRLARPDMVMLGHIHKTQEHCVLDDNEDVLFPVVYSGSPGRLNFGETEEKCFYLWETAADGTLRRYWQVPTPARRFVLRDIDWKDLNSFQNTLYSVCTDCKGAFVRIRLSIPEEDAKSLDRGLLKSLLEDAGAAYVKFEVQIIPKQRQRAAGISRIESLPAKFAKWGAAVGQEISDDAFSISSRIEGLSVEELLADDEWEPFTGVPDEPLREAA